MIYTLPLAIAQGNLIPAFHKNYWVGFKATTTAPNANFKYVDPYAGTFDSNAYSHWGIYTVRDGSEKACGVIGVGPACCRSSGCLEG
jgi:hypothetical protein